MLLPLRRVVFCLENGQFSEVDGLPSSLGSFRWFPREHGDASLRVVTITGEVGFLSR